MLVFMRLFCLLAAATAACVVHAREKSMAARPETAEVAALKARVSELEAALAEKDARIAQLSEKPVVPQQALPSAVASRSASSVSSSTEGAAPSSSLPVSQALTVATAARFLVPGAGVLAVQPTGSMKPVFDENALLLTEPASFDDLKVGDIVTYRHPDLGMPVVHRIAEKHGDRLWAKGDGNARMDDIYITRENYQARVFGIVYAAGTSVESAGSRKR